MNCIYIFPKRYFSCKPLLISDILMRGKEIVGKQTTVKGWVKNLRVQKEIVFTDINDGSSAQRLQILFPKSTLPENLSFGSAVKVTGQLTTSPHGKLELAANQIEVLGECELDEKYPFRPRKSYSPDYCRQFLHFRPRTNSNASLLRLRNGAVMAIHNYFQSNGFINVHSPILTSNDCEGAGELFKVLPDNQKTLTEMKKENSTIDEAYFNTKAFLTVSGQLHLEALCRGVGNVYILGPCFRAENSKSRLHLSEFSMIEAEVAFCDRIEDLTQLTENLIKHIFTQVYEHYLEDLKILYQNKVPNFDWVNDKFQILTYKEAIEICQRHLDSPSMVSKIDEALNKEQELFLVKHCNSPVFIVEWPKHLKSFYTRETRNNSEMVDAFDLLAPITGEIVGGTLREDDYKKLQAKLPSERLNWYLDLRRYGNIPTGGFGLGLERLLQWLCNVENIKDTVPFPRWPHNCQM